MRRPGLPACAAVGPTTRSSDPSTRICSARGCRGHGPCGAACSPTYVVSRQNTASVAGFPLQLSSFNCQQGAGDDRINSCGDRSYNNYCARLAFLRCGFKGTKPLPTAYLRANLLTGKHWARRRGGWNGMPSDCTSSTSRTRALSR